jgi:putative ABC transport system permease protein
MLRNYFKVALRNILRSKVYSFINIIGLSVGIAGFALIFSYVYNEMNYDSFHKNADRIYRIYTEGRSPNGEVYDARTPDPLPKALRNDYPGLSKVVRLFRNQFWVTRDDKAFKELVFGSDPSFFDVFNFRLLNGDRRSVLDNPNSVVITKEFAEKIFGNDDPMGKVLKINNFDFIVTGVLDDFPVNSSIKFDILIPAKIRNNFDPGFEDKWYSSGTYTFVELSGEISPNELQNQLTQILNKYMPGFLKGRATLGIEPLKDVHLDSRITEDIIPPVSRSFLYILLGVAVSILLISSINFMNISISRYTERAKEIGMRKVLGANRSQLVKQFMCESVLMSLASLIIGVGLAELFLGRFNVLTGKEIELSPFLTFPNVFVVIGFGIVVGLISGSYPAFFLSSFTPVQVLAKQSSGNKKSNVRNVLVVSQFAIAVMLMTGFLLIDRQVNFMVNYDMGFQPKDIVAISVEDESRRGQMVNINAFMNSINTDKAATGITSLCISENIPGYYFSNDFGVVPIGADGKKPLQMIVSSVDENFLDTYRATLTEGRNFSPLDVSDKTDVVILNETAARRLGWTDAVGKEIRYVHEDHPLTVIGVAKDINISSLQDPVQPVIFRYAAGDYERHFISVRIDPSRSAAALSSLKSKWKEIFPDWPFEYFFVLDKYRESYQSQQNLEDIIGIFSSLAIVLACLGLFGLASLKVTQRTKEIGIRKVLGATIPGILSMFTQEFLILIVTANVIAVPVSYFVLNTWLQDFAYRTNIGVDIFIITAAMTLLIAFIAISFQAIKAATANPVESLRYE